MARLIFIVLLLPSMASALVTVRQVPCPDEHAAPHGAKGSLEDLITEPMPQYTRIGWFARVEGTTRLKFEIGTDGEMSNIVVLTTLPMGLDDAAVIAVKRWTSAKPVGAGSSLGAICVEFAFRRDFIPKVGEQPTAEDLEAWLAGLATIRRVVDGEIDCYSYHKIEDALRARFPWRPAHQGVLQRFLSSPDPVVRGIVRHRLAEVSPEVSGGSVAGEMLASESRCVRCLGLGMSDLNPIYSEGWERGQKLEGIRTNSTSPELFPSTEMSRSSWKGHFEAARVSGQYAFVLTRGADRSMGLYLENSDGWKPLCAKDCGTAGEHWWSGKRRLKSMSKAGLLGCGGVSPVSADWKSVESSCGFAFMAPPDLKEVPVQGIDSCVEDFVTDECKMGVDYGLYSDDLTSSGMDGVIQTVVDGQEARLVTENAETRRRPFLAAIHFPKVPSKRKGMSLTMMAKCKTREAQEGAKALFRTITFPPPR